MNDKLLIDVTRLDKEGEDLEGVLDDAVLELDGDLLRPFAGIRYSIFVQQLGSELLARGTLAQDFDAVCSRCGGDFDFTVKVPDFTVSVETDDKTEYVDLTDEVRQSIILALPTYPVCRPECLGVCPSCGKNLNEGPCGCTHEEKDGRWGALDGLDLSEHMSE
jgi:uncharacterized protein